MRDDDNYSVSRRNKRQRKNADKILNISIGIVLLLILLIGGQLLLGGKSDPVSSDKVTENEPLDDENELDENQEQDEIPESLEPLEEENEDQSSSQPELNESKQQETHTSSEQNNVRPTENNNRNNAGAEAGQWTPIGTVQPEPFTAVYDQEHVNWQEMTRAFQYATGIGENITIWWIRNGGNHQSAIGIVSDYPNRNTPYEVRIEWVTNQGWKPVSVKKLDSNPYLPNNNQSSNETTNESNES